MGVFQRFANIFRAKANKVLDRAENPADMLDQTYRQLLEDLAHVRRALVDISTARKRLEIQGDQLKHQADKLQEQAKAALQQGNEPLAREALSRRQLLADQLTDLGTQHQQTQAQQDRLQQTAHNLETQVSTFRTKKETLKASYAASQAQVRVTESITGISGSSSDAAAALERAEDKITQMQARAGAIDDLMFSGALSTGSGEDFIQRQLSALTASSAVETELAALKAELPPAPELTPTPPA